MDCEWSAWQTGPCSVSCGGGTRTSNRSKTVEENYGGECIGQPIFHDVCNTQNCPSKGKINESLNIKNANTIIYIVCKRSKQYNNLVLPKALGVQTVMILHY